MQRSGTRATARGQVIIMFALLLTALMGMVGLGIDSANAFARKRAVQSAADLAALAGGLDLPSATASTSASTFASLNGFSHGQNGATVVVNRPYGGDNNRLEIKIAEAVPTRFLGVLGYNTIDVEGRAVAGVATTPANYTIFAGYTDCTNSDAYKGIDWSGSTDLVTGAVHSNVGINIGGSNNTVHGPTSYRGELGNCHFYKDATTTLSQPQVAAGVQLWPITYTTADFPCTGPDVVVSVLSGDLDLNQPNGTWWVGVDPSTSTQLKPGKYCALNGEIKLSRQGVSGNVTFIGNKIDISGSNYNLSAYTNNVVLFANGTGSPFIPALKTAGGGGTWTGAFYAPHGQAEVSGSTGQTLNGQIVAQTVKLNGSGWSVTGPYGGTPSVSRPRLFE